MLGKHKNKYLELCVETLTNQNKIYDKLNEKSSEIEKLHAKIKRHEYMIRRFTNNSKNLNHILHQSQISKNKSGLGFNSNMYHRTQNAIRYNKRFVHEFTYEFTFVPKNYQKITKHRMLTWKPHTYT